jgi:hypothetical protein
MTDDWRSLKRKKKRKEKREKNGNKYSLNNNTFMVQPWDLGENSKR